MLRKAFGGYNRAHVDSVAALHGRQTRLAAAVGTVIVAALDIYTQEAVETYHLATGRKMVGACRGRDIYSSTVDTRIGHLRSDGTLPDKGIQASLLQRSFNFGHMYISRTYSLVGLLGTFGISMITAHF